MSAAATRWRLKHGKQVLHMRVHMFKGHPHSTPAFHTV